MAGMTRAEVVDRSGSHTAVYDLLRGENVRLSTLESIAKAMGLRVVLTLIPEDFNERDDDNDNDDDDFPQVAGLCLHES
jgi:transcriptional regulator with XRE-family HTH domain